MRNKIMALLVAIFAACMLCFTACTTDSDINRPESTGSDQNQESTLPDDGSDPGTDDPDDPQPSLDAEYIAEADLPVSTLNTQADADGDVATAAWFITYAEDGLAVKAVVKDGSIATFTNLYNSDGIEVIVAKEQRVKDYSEGTISVVVSAKGDYVVKNLYTGEAVEAELEVGATKYTHDEQTVAGYILSVLIPYELTEIDAEQKNAAVCLGLTNAVNAMSSKSVYDATYGTVAKNVHTYMAVPADNEYQANEFVQFGGVWGSAGSLNASPVWNTDTDFGENAYISSNGIDNKDNYIYMYKSGESTTYYAEAQFNVKELFNGEKWGKFGFYVVTEDGQTGFFYYVDATSANGTTFDNGAVALGYNTKAGGNWENKWAAIGSLGGTSEQYLGENYVTLGVYRQGSIFKLYANGEYVSTISTVIGSEAVAYAGIACFNMTLNVKGYSIETNPENLGDYVIEKQNVDYLFIGDSYVDKAFWYTYDQTFGGLSAANEGIGGTKVGYWTNQLASLQARYEAKNVIVHIGVNDIDDGNTTGEQAIALLNTLFSGLQNTYPDAQIYYVGLVHNMMFQGKWAEYDKVNAWVAEYAKNNEALTYIDMASVITANDQGSTMSWFNGDGLHYGVDGYAAWTKAILNALGIERQVSVGGLGDVNLEGAPDLAYSGGWKFEDGVAHNTGVAESQIFLSGLYATDFYAEVKLSVAGLNAPDDWAKAGLAFRSLRKTAFWAIDAANAYNDGGKYYSNNWSNVFIREDVLNRDWNWGGLWANYKYIGAVSYDYKTDKSFKTMAVAKYEGRIYFYADGELIATADGVYGADEKVAVSVFNFNMDMYAKDAKIITDKATLDEMFLVPHAVTSQLPEGVTATPSVESARRGQTVTFTLDAGNALISTVYVNGEEILANEQGVYSFVMPDAEAVITATVKGQVTINTAAVDGKVQVSETVVYEGETVTITACENIKVIALYANGNALVADENGAYTLTVTENVTLTGEFLYSADGITLDGVKEEKYGATTTTASYDDNRSITLSAVKTQSGLFVHVVAYMNTTKNDAEAWHENTNLEFFLNSVARENQHYVSINGARGGVTSHVWKTTKIDDAENAHNGKFEYIIELYISKDLVEGWNDQGSVQINYAWKTPGEVAHVADGALIHPYTHVSSDYLANHFGGANIGIRDFAANLGTYGDLDKSLQITANGLQIKGGAVATKATIDGDLTEYAQKKAITVGDIARTQVTITGFGAEDGLYLALTLNHGNWGAYSGNWWENDNIEIRINSYHTGLIFTNEGKLLYSAFFAQGAMKTVEQEGRLVSTVELFMPSNLQAFYLQFGIAGAGFGGWQSLVWDANNLEMTADGAVGIIQTLDGVLTEAEGFTAEVLANAHTTTANGATVTLVGRTGIYGVHLGFTIVHTKGIYEACQEDGTQWWHFIGTEVRVNGLDVQIATTPWNNHAIKCYSGFTTVDNADGTHTTTIEMVVFPFGDPAGDVSLSVAGIFEKGFIFLYGSDGWATPLKVTANGIVKA
ncbi:MAG: hypothetical protein IJW13_00395 [Clostridia bacterium]|nr:hypothetical protein [Clostridia bacterium]